MYGNLNTPVIKGVAKCALGTAVIGMAMALDNVNMLNGNVGKATKYAAIAAGALYALSGCSKIIVGE